MTYPSSTQIKVVVSNSTPSFFGRVFGITSANVGATAIAGQPVGKDQGTFASGPNPLASLSPWPFDYSLPALKPACTQSAASFTFSSGNSINAVYCATGNISISDGVSLPNATLIANAFTINGNNIIINTIFAPQAEVLIDGNSSNNTMNSFVEGFDVSIKGNNHTINGTGPPSVGFLGALQR